MALQYFVSTAFLSWMFEAPVAPFVLVQIIREEKMPLLQSGWDLNLSLGARRQT